MNPYVVHSSHVGSVSRRVLLPLQPSSVPSMHGRRHHRSQYLYEYAVRKTVHTEHTYVYKLEQEFPSLHWPCAKLIFALVMCFFPH